jgi:hypothetical protein
MKKGSVGEKILKSVKDIVQKEQVPGATDRQKFGKTLD